MAMLSIQDINHLEQRALEALADFLGNSEEVQTYIHAQIAAMHPELDLDRHLTSGEEELYTAAASRAELKLIAAYMMEAL